jgi:hypothetical protein
MKAVAATLLTIAAVAASAVPVLGQEESAPPEDTAVPLTVITNEEFCGLLGLDLLVCEGIITGMATARIAPDAFAGLITAELAGEATTGTPEAEPPGDGSVGDTLARSDLEITLLKADWKPDWSDAFFKPGKGNKYVSVLVEYKALQDGAYYDINSWDATDKAGTRYTATVLGPITPDLKVGHLAEGETMKGWVTFEVPRDAGQLRVIESQVLQPDLAWNTRR